VVVIVSDDETKYVNEVQTKGRCWDGQKVMNLWF